MPTRLPITFDDVSHAARRLAGIVHRTPVVTSRTLNALTGREVWCKCENFQRIGAFKLRGAFNRMVQLGEEQRRHGVIAFSSGNHGQGVALAGQLLGVPATIVMPNDASRVKVAAIRGYGAEVIEIDPKVTDRGVFAAELARERGLTLIPPYDDPDIMAGQGTAALELLHEVPDLDALVVPIGGGGLISGCAVAARRMNPLIAIYGVEPETADDARQSLRAGSIVKIPPPTTIADGVRTTAVGHLTFEVIRNLVTDIVTVSDREIIQAVQFALFRMKLVCEPTGAVPLAAVLQNRIPASARRVGILISGGNIDPEVLRQLLAEPQA